MGSQESCPSCHHCSHALPPLLQSFILSCTHRISAIEYPNNHLLLPFDVSKPASYDSPQMLPVLFATILPAAVPRKKPFWPLLLSVFLFSLLTIFLNLGRWLVVEDPLSHASAIAVLSGRMPARALE